MARGGPSLARETARSADGQQQGRHNDNQPSRPHHHACAGVANSGVSNCHQQTSQRGTKRVRFAANPVTAVRERPRTQEHEKPLLYYGEQAFADFSREAYEEERWERRMRKRKQRAMQSAPVREDYMNLGANGSYAHARRGGGWLGVGVAPSQGAGSGSDPRRF